MAASPRPRSPLCRRGAEPTMDAIASGGLHPVWNTASLASPVRSIPSSRRTLLARMSRRRLLACLALMPVLWSEVCHAQPQAKVQAPRQRRVALVIGNGRYPEIPLNNPEHDARLVAQTLRSLDFEVGEHLNLNCPRLQARAAGIRAPHGRRPGRVGLLLRRPRRADRRAQLPAAGRHRAARRGRSARRGHRHAGSAARACRPGASTRPHLHHRRLPQRPLRGARASFAQRQRPGRDGGAGCPHRFLRSARRGRRGRPDRRQQHLHASPRHRAAHRRASKSRK